MSQQRQPFDHATRQAVALHLVSFFSFGSNRRVREDLQLPTAAMAPLPCPSS